MISNYLRSKGLHSILFCLALAFFTATAFAANGDDQGQQPWFNQLSAESFASLTPESMIENFSKQIPSLMRLVTAIGYVMGMYFVIIGVIQLKHFGESRTMMSSEHSLKSPIIYITVGALLIYLPTTVSVGMSTFWTNPAPYGYNVGQQQQDQWTDFINICFLIVQFVGTIAFIRGLVILTQLAGHAQQGTFARGLTHIIGGIFCINIYQFVQVILVTLGVQT